MMKKVNSNLIILKRVLKFIFFKLFQFHTNVTGFFVTIIFYIFKRPIFYSSDLNGLDLTFLRCLHIVLN